MEIKERIEKSVTRQFKVIFPNTLNAHDTLFGGTAMQWMDEVAYITATRFTKMKMVTISTPRWRGACYFSIKNDFPFLFLFKMP